jgi:hypothetical protein
VLAIVVLSFSGETWHQSQRRMVLCVRGRVQEVREHLALVTLVTIALAVARDDLLVALVASGQSFRL